MDVHNLCEQASKAGYPFCQRAAAAAAAAAALFFSVAPHWAALFRAIAAADLLWQEHQGLR
jgi:hypothetical protein